MRRRIVTLSVGCFLGWAGSVAGQEGQAVAQMGVESGPKVVVLGTGTPNADPERSGPAVAIVFENRAYLVDAGPGVVRRAAAAAEAEGIEALEPPGLNRLFLTHLHSDHTLGLPDLILTPWVLERPDPIQVVGPPGTEEMVQHILRGWRQDINMRLFGLEPRGENPQAYRAPVDETEGGLVLDDGAVRVTAIPVLHANWEYAFGYRFEAGGQVIVVSGDARPSENLVEACNGCDVLVHEVYSTAGFQTRPPDWQEYHASAHTSTAELAELANRAQPKLLVLYHQLYWGTTDDDLIQELRDAGYEGAVVSASDLGVYP
ncbi:MAG: MBL fold metallo-hydrolase [Longimicrobiales bacterium]